MGLFFAKLFCQKKMRILMAGLDDGGKKTIFYKLKFGKALRKISTVGFDIETVEYKNVRFTVRNIDARDKVRVLWRPLFQDTQGIIYVVDSINRDRISEARHQLDGILKEHELSDAVLLVFVNKQNLPNAMTIAELTDKLGLNELRRRHWYIQSSCITQGQGFYDGLDWLCSHS